MKVQTVKRMHRLQEWAMQISVCRQSGLTVRQWCIEQGINAKTFYNRMKVVREELLEMAEAENVNRINNVNKAGAAILLQNHNQHGITGENQTGRDENPVFAALPIPQAATAAISIRMGNCAIDLQNGADSSMVEQVLRLAAQL